MQVFHSLSRGFFSLEFLLETRLGVVPSVLEFLIEALLDYYVLELGYSALWSVVWFQINCYHFFVPVLCVSLTPTPIVYHMSRALSTAAVCSTALWFGMILVGALCSGEQFGVIVTDVRGESSKWPNEDD